MEDIPLITYKNTRKEYLQKYYEANKENIITQSNKAKKARELKQKQDLRVLLSKTNEEILREIILNEIFYDKHWNIIQNIYLNVNKG